MRIPNYHQNTSVSVPSVASPCVLDQTLTLHPETDAIYDISTTLTLDNQEIGSVTGWVVLKDSYHRGKFHHDMDAVSQETKDFAVGLFDDKARLKDRIIEHPVRKGTGVWGRELDNGGLVITYSWDVNSKYRGKGIGKWLLDRHFEIPQIQKYCSFAYTAPAYMGEDKEDMTIKQFEAATKRTFLFFRKQGYRRVGVSNFFCRPLDRNSTHAALSLPIENDIEPPSSFTEAEGDESAPAFPDPFEQFHAPNKNLTKFPLHAAIMNNGEDAALVQILQARIKDPSSILKKDVNGATLLHIAAHKAYTRIILFLLGAGFSKDDRTVDGWTAAECLEEVITSSQEYHNCFSIPWKGPSEDQTAALELLKKTPA